MNKASEKSNNVFGSSANKHVKSRSENHQFKYFKKGSNQVSDLYDFEQTIGQGHYAVVKLARHVFTGEKVAVKIIDKIKLDKISRDHLFQEVKCMKLVQHANVVRLYEVIDTPSKLYLILELGDGGDMYDLIMKQTNGISELMSKNYFSQIVSALKYCHDLHVVHRDLKPENVVFFSQTGQVKLTDFGFSNIFIPGTKLLTSCGSLAYSAPEILLGDSYDAPAVDIWSLGVILYMLVTGRAPFQEANDSETLTMILDCKYYLPPTLTSECIDLISRMLVRNPEKRIHLDDIVNHTWFKGLEDSNSTETSELSSSSDENCGLTSNGVQSLGDSIGGNNSVNKRVRSGKSKEELIKMMTLIKRENLTEKQNTEIIDFMINGEIANREEIIKALDEDQYNYITGTYYLLAEKIIKKQLLRRIKRKQVSMAANLKQKRDLQLKNQQANNTCINTTPIVVPNQNQYQMKRKLNAQPQRNKLVRQVEEATEIEADSAIQESIAEESIAELQPVANILLTNIIEDEEESPEIKTRPIQDPAGLFLVNNVTHQPRRSSRGTDINSAITALTILEEVETDQSPQKASSHLKSIDSRENELITADSIDKHIEVQSRPTSSTDRLEKNGKKFSKVSHSSGADTSCSDNSDSEFKKQKHDFLGLKDHDWSRSASSSSARSRTRYRNSANAGISHSLIEKPIGKRERPLSISADTTYKDDVNGDLRLPIFHTEILGNKKESALSSGCLSITSPYKQSISSSNSNDYLSSNLNSKSLSIEHRLANMSQMSINSQLSKNNSIRQRPSGSETPLHQQLSQMSSQHSATPTPRESIVFNRGDEKPYEKILLSNGKSSSMLSADGDGLKGKSLGSISGDEHHNDDLKMFKLNIPPERRVSELTPNIPEFNLKGDQEPTKTTITGATRPFSTENLIKTQFDNYNSIGNDSSTSTLRHNNDSYSTAINNAETQQNNNNGLTQKSIETSNSSKSINETHSSRLDDSDKTLKSSEKNSFITQLTNRSPGSLKSNKVSNKNNGVNIHINQDESNLLHSSNSTTKVNKKSKSSISGRPSLTSASSVTKKKCIKCCTII